MLIISHFGKKGEASEALDVVHIGSSLFLRSFTRRGVLVCLAAFSVYSVGSITLGLHALPVPMSCTSHLGDSRAMRCSLTMLGLFRTEALSAKHRPCTAQCYSAQGFVFRVNSNLHTDFHR